MVVVKLQAVRARESLRKLGLTFQMAMHGLISPVSVHAGSAAPWCDRQIDRQVLHLGGMVVGALPFHTWAAIATAHAHGGHKQSRKGRSPPC